MARDLILGIDASTAIASVGLVQGDQRIAEICGIRGARHGSELLPLIEKVFELSGRKLTDIDCIGVVVGPGSFSGLRVAVATAKGLGYSLSKKVIGVSTLEALGHTVPTSEGRTRILLDARGGEVYWATFQYQSHGGIVRITDDALEGLEKLLTLEKSPAVLFCETREGYDSTVHRIGQTHSSFLSFGLLTPLACPVAALAQKMLKNEDNKKLSEIVPQYHRKSYAEKNTDSDGTQRLRGIAT